MRHGPECGTAALWVGIALLCLLCCSPRFLLFLLAVTLILFGVCCRKR